MTPKCPNCKRDQDDCVCVDEIEYLRAQVAELKAENQQEELQEAFAAFAAEYPQSALALITGLFVGLLEYSVKEQGGDETLPIKIDGCGKRDITVSAKPHNAGGNAT